MLMIIKFLSHTRTHTHTHTHTQTHTNTHTPGVAESHRSLLEVQLDSPERTCRLWQSKLISLVANVVLGGPFEQVAVWLCGCVAVVLCVYRVFFVMGG